MNRNRWKRISLAGIVAACLWSPPSFGTWIVRVTGETEKSYKGTITYVPDGRWLRTVLLIDGKVIIF